MVGFLTGVFRFIVLTQKPTRHSHTYIHTHIHRDKVIAKSAPLYYVIGGDNKSNKLLLTVTLPTLNKSESLPSLGKFMQLRSKISFSLN